MKKELFQKTKTVMQLFMLTVLLFGFKAKAQCSIDIVLGTQAEVNAFPVNYPTCTQILGDLFILGSDITNLTPLSNLTSVGGVVYIDGTDALTNLNGLNNLISIGNYLELRFNTSLTNLNGLSSLTSVGGYLKIHSNTSLPNLNGLSSLTSIGDYLQINNNSALTSLDGLNNLTSVGSFIEILINDSLTNLNGLIGVTSIGDDLVIGDNVVLSNISGVRNINPATIGALQITNNPALPVCNLPNICTFLSGPGLSYIFGNLANCVDEVAVIAACNNLSISEIDTNQLSYYPNPVKDLFNLFNNREMTHVFVINMLGQTVINQNVDSKQSTQIDMTLLPAGKYLVIVTSEATVKTIKVVKQ